MLEGLVATLLNRFLGMYVKGFNAKDLNVGIWSNEIKLRNLELRREALDQLHLPVNVVEGRVGNLRLDLPLRSLGSKPVTVHIEDVFLLAAPKEEAEYDEEEEKRRNHAVKMEKLENAELLREKNTEGMSQEEQKKNQTFIEAMVSTIVDNLQVTIKNIHIRYEDSIAAPGHPFALGVTLKELSAVSTDENWTPKFISSSSSTTHKLASLGSLAVYWNTDAELIGTGRGGVNGGGSQDMSTEELIEAFRKGIEESESHQYMLKPVSGRAGIEIDKTGKIDKPKIRARLLFNELGFILDDHQYRDALMMVDLFHYFIRHQEYKKLQPKEPPKENPRAWIKFAGQAVLDRIHQRNRQWTWAYLSERKEKRNKYIEIFKKQKKEEQLSADEKTSLKELEEELSYEDLRFWRSLARNQLRKENVGVKKKPEAKQGWGSWIWGSGQKTDQQAEHTEEQVQMTDEERQKLMEVIDYDEKKAIAESVDAPREAVKFQIESALRTGSFTLKRDPHGKKTEVLNLIFDNFQAKALKRTDSILADVSLGGLRLYDGTTPDSLFKQIVKVKDTAAVPKDHVNDDTEMANEDLDKESEENADEKLFHFVLENNPLDESADTAITLKLRSFEIIYNPRFVVEIAKFFKPPERHMESIGALMETAGATVEGLRQQTRAGLEFALQEHKTINANFDIRAPLIIVPESVVNESTLCLILDAGHASVNSELIDKKTLQEIRSKQKAQYSAEDYHRLENLMYDKFALKLDSTQVLIGPGIEATRKQLDARDENKSYHIIDRINMDFLLELSILPKDTELTKTRVTGTLPVLQASISDKKYKNLMRLIDIAIPNFNDDEATKKPVQMPAKDRRKSKALTVGNEVAGRQRSKSFQSHPGDEDLIVDEEHDGKIIQQTKQNGKTVEVNLHQRNFEFRFTVEKLQGSLYRSDPNGKKPDQLLVELVAEHFHLDFYQRPYDIVAEVVLRSLAVEDYVEENPTPEFKNIISSQEADGSETKDLVTVKFVRVNKDSPEFTTTYEGIALNLDVAVSTINVVVTRKTLLTLLDFILITFTNQAGDNAQNDAKAIEDVSDDEEDNTELTSEPDKIRVKADLNRIALILNNDGIRLATLGLNTAHVGVFLAGGAMRVDARLGELSLLDDVNQGASESSSLRRLVAIEGDELADFKYETFDGEQASDLGYDARVFLRSGSLKVNFVEEPFRKIIGFLVKFGQMQAIFNAARQAAANQANQMQERAGKMHFDVLVKTPIIVFPRAMLEDRPRDLITAYLGEIYAKNEFVAVKASKKGAVANNIGAGIRNIRLTSEFHFENGQSEEIEMIDKVDLDFKVRYIEHEAGLQRPDMEIEGGISPVNLRVSQTQMKFLLELSRSVPGAFAADSDESNAEAKKELPRSTVESAKKAPSAGDKKDNSKLAIRSQGPELGRDSESWTKLDLTFKAPTIGLELINSTNEAPIGDLAEASLSIFAINNTSVKLKMLSDGALESELLVHSFTIKDSRTIGTNKFRKVMSLINDDVKQQLMASFTMSAGEDRHLIAMVTLDSPKIIFAMDYIFALVNFANTAFASEQPSEIDEALEESDDDTGTESNLSVPSTPARSSFDDSDKGSSMVMSFRVNIEDAQVILIANPAIPHSEAIVLGTKQVLVSQQNATTLQVTKVGMFLCRMDKFDSSRLRILDDFSVTMSMENRSSGPKAVLTTMHIDIEPLVLRLSLRDILLATQIVNKASAMSATKVEDIKDDEPQKLKEVKAENPARSSRPLTSKKAKSTATGKSQGLGQVQRRQTATMRREEMNAEIQGIRVVLIGDLHELPLIDWSVKKFDVDIRDWSTALTGDTNLNTYINVYNFSKSAWEPLIEPWQLGFHMAKEQHPDRLAVELFSHKNLELTVTSATIALASKSAQFLSTDEDMLSKPRSSDAPYKIRNYTGFDLDVWAANREEDQGSAAKLSDGEEIPWRFEDATTMRESLSPEGNAGVVGIRLQGSGFDSIQRIHVNREGETLYNLKPKQERIQHRLLVEVKLGSDNVKYITFRSPLLVENNTQIPIELGIFSPEEGHLLKIEKIAPGEGRPAPVGAAFKHSLVVRPDQGFGYTWSNERLFWKDLLRRSTRTITCKGESSGDTPPFFFQMNANFNQNDPMTNVYPYMRIKLSAPIELQNLLPFDFKYRIYDKNTKKDWTNFLRRGGISPIHVVELSHLLLLSVEMQDTVFKASEFAVINSTTRDDFKRETTLPTKDRQDNQLNLKLHYFNLPESGGAFKVSIYSPYLVLNKTGLDLGVQAKQKYSSRSSGGVGIQSRTNDSSGKAMPYMFSYPNDDRKNRAMLKIGDSEWSHAQSLDAIGSSFEVLLPSKNKRSEMHAGVHVSEGEGKYNLTKVVTIAPRFVIKNKIEKGKTGETMQVREPGSSSIQEIKPGALLPLRFLRKTPDTQICLCFPGVNNIWSSPFSVSSVGTMHVKLAKAGQRQDLIRAEVIMEGATLFIHLSIESKHWPFSMRNESETSFMFYQTNPNVTDDEEDRSSGWRPIRYRLPKRSIMPYAWDFPAAKHKELVVVAYDSSEKRPTSRERRVKLAEIGNLMPLKTSEGTTIDLNIVAEGPTQTLVFSKWRPQKSLYRQKTGSASQTSVSTGFEVKDLESDVTFKAELRLQGIGISLINQKVRELLYFTLRGLDLKYHDSKLYQTVRATVKWIQIDNQLYGGIFPILLYPSVVPKTGKEMEAHPIFHAQVTRVKDDSYGVLYIKYATLLLQQLTVEIDEDFIYAMLDFTKVPGASWTEEAEGKLADDDLDVPEPTREQSGQDVYFETLHLQPMQIDLSFVRTERINAEDTATSSNPLMFAVNVLTMSIGNVNDAPLRFNALLLENARISIPALVNNIRDHYTQEALRQVHVVLGSADFLGNPVGLFNNISSGVMDIFYEPYQGLVMTDRPQELGIGIAKGASSFVKKSVFGFSDSMAKFTGSMAKGFAAATLDKEYQDQRRMSKARNRPKHALYGVTSGGNAFASSLASGIGGLARHPLEGAEQEGLGGFVKGVGKGFLGLATKPAIGAFDLASNLAEGVRNTTTVFDQEGLDRVRLTRFVGLDSIVRPYSQREALGQFWLKTVDDGKYFSEDYIAHLELSGKDMLIMLTYSRIMLVKSKRLKTEWDIKLTDIQTISKERTGMSVTLKGGTNGPFIPVAEEDARNWLYKQIAVAVNAFNDRYNAKG